MQWNRYIKSESVPPENQAVLVSDGELQAIARYILSENHINWIFDNSSLKDVDIQWWMELPVMPPKIISLDSTVAPV